MMDFDKLFKAENVVVCRDVTHGDKHVWAIDNSDNTRIYQNDNLSVKTNIDNKETEFEIDYILTVDRDTGKSIIIFDRNKDTYPELKNGDIIECSFSIAWKDKKYLGIVCDGTVYYENGEFSPIKNIVFGEDIKRYWKNFGYGTCFNSCLARPADWSAEE